MTEQELIKLLDERMKKSIQSVKSEFAKIRGNRASTAILDDVRVDYYGTPMPLTQLSAISTPEPRTIVISPWDKSAIALIEKAIQQADLGLGINNDGNVVRLNLPPLTEERRKELVKVVKRIAEECRVAMRHIRRDGNELVKAELKAKKITEDDEKRLLKKVQDMTDEAIRQIDSSCANKEKDIMEV